MAFSCSANTTDVIQFISSVFSPHSNPENIVRDNGTQFTSEFFTSFRGISQQNICLLPSSKWSNWTISSWPLHLHPDINPAVTAMEADCVGLASSLLYNTAWDNFHLSLWTPAWKKDAAWTGHTTFAFFCKKYQLKRQRYTDAKRQVWKPSHRRESEDEETTSFC